MNQNNIYINVLKSIRTWYSLQEDKKKSVSYRFDILTNSYSLSNIFFNGLKRIIRWLYRNHCIISCLFLPFFFTSHNIRNINPRLTLSKNFITELIHKNWFIICGCHEWNYNISFLESCACCWCCFSWLTWSYSC